MMRRTAVLFSTLSLVIVLAGCSKSTPNAADQTTTTGAAANKGVNVDIIDGKKYDPTTETVKANQVVTWVNKSGSDHTVTASPGQADATFRSEVLKSGGTFVQTFTKPGKYAYFCNIHGADVMSGTIEVTP